MSDHIPDPGKMVSARDVDEAVTLALMAGLWNPPGHKIDPAAFLTALAAAGYVIEQDWQPIETAPRDGTRVMLWIVGRCGINEVNIPTVGSWWADDADCWVEDGYDTVIPTYWRPLPAPPAAAKETKA